MDRTSLHSYQNACVNHILFHKFCGVFLDMGLGKTVVTLTAINDLLFDYCEIKNVLIIAPKRVVDTVWDVEALKWDHLKHLQFSKMVGTEAQRITALKQKANIYLISRDNIAWLCAYCGGAKLPFDMIVIDELSSFKSYKSQRFKALRQVQPYFKRFVGLTGTPAPNGLIDLWPQIYLMDRGERLEKTITRFREKYFRPGKTNGHIVYSYTPLKDTDKQIHDKISDICISMQADDYIRMPLRTDNYITLTMPEKIKKQYDDFEKNKVLEMIDRYEKVIEIDDFGNEHEVIKPVTVGITNAVALSNKLLQFANGAVYRSQNEMQGIQVKDQQVDREAICVHDIKINALKEIMENCNGKPVLVAWTFRFDRDRIMEELKDYNPRELKTAVDVNDWNAGKIQLMLAHPASAGHGLNLQAGGNIIVWYGQTWSLELYQQFNARLYRQGQQNCVIINHLIMKGTHDEDVITALRSKSLTQNSLMNSIKFKMEKYKKYSKSAYLA